MKAYITTQFGPPEVLKLQEAEKPIPKSNQILIKVKATSVNAADSNMRGRTYIPSGLGLLSKLMLGFKKPKIAVQGSVLAGDVVEVGDKVREFKVRDKVFGTGPEMGAYGEYALRSESGAVSIIPDNISYEEAASVPYGALTALYFLQNLGNIQESQKVLVKGASGGVGTYAVQLASHFGAEVTGVCSTRNVEYVKSLGAQKVIDYSKEDFTTSSEKYDIIFDVVVGKTSFKQIKELLNPGGYYLAVAGGLNDMLQMVKTSISGSKKVKFGGGTACEIKSNLDFLASLLKEGKLQPTVDRVFTFDEMVEAHAYAESGQKKGNVVISMERA
jgi:NADPH:quinone reductase-like Zn-dependent oxidoreductase